MQTQQHYTFGNYSTYAPRDTARTRNIAKRQHGSPSWTWKASSTEFRENDYSTNSGMQESEAKVSYSLEATLNSRLSR